MISALSVGPISRPFPQEDKGVRPPLALQRPISISRSVVDPSRPNAFMELYPRLAVCASSHFLIPPASTAIRFSSATVLSFVLSSTHVRCLVSHHIVSGIYLISSFSFLRYAFLQHSALRSLLVRSSCRAKHNLNRFHHPSWVVHQSL